MKRMLHVAVLAVAAAVLGVGCGPSLSSVECKVTLDDKAVSGATVSFIPQDEALQGKVQPTGMTDANGVCTMKTGDKNGVAKGKYKVVVTKIPEVTGMTDEEKERPGMAMEKLMKSGQLGGATKPGPGGGGAPGRPGGGGAPASKNVLPDEYSTPDKTTLSVDVPTSGQVSLNLKSSK